MCEKTIIDQYLDAGKRLTLLDGKAPILSKWTEKEVSGERIQCHKGNLGWVIGDGDLVVDVDPKNGGDESWSKLCSELGLDLEPTVNTPSGGFHIYLSCPIGSYKKNLKKYPGIDFLTKGSQCVIPSSSIDGVHYAWDDEDFGCFAQDDAPEALVDLIKGEDRTVEISKNLDLGDFEGLIGNSTTSASEVIELLVQIDNNLPNDDWVRVGMALKTWHPVDGLVLWENWSQGGDTYKEGETAKRWKSFKGDSVTLGTLNYLAKSGSESRRGDLLDGYISRIKSADETELRVEVAPAIMCDLGIDAEGRNRLAVMIQSRIGELTTIKPPISICRDMVEPRGERYGEEEAPDWCSRWVYVSSHSAWYDIKRLVEYKTAAFNLKCGKLVPAGENGRKQLASAYVSDRGFIKCVDTINYLPQFEDRIVKINGRVCLNSFNHKSVPTADDEISDEGLAAIELVKKHMIFIFGNKKKARIFLQWVAHNVQYPGVKILWSPVIQSIEGAGKSFFGELLKTVMGDENVGVVSPSQVTSQFNSWAVGVCVNVLEELKLAGHNRHDAINALKPLITDAKVQVNTKGVSAFEAMNTCNYICFTNFMNALPLTINDRRWWVNFASISSLDEMEEPAAVYFPRLFDAVRSHPGAMRKWLLEYEISDEFMGMKQAPMTDEKRMMVDTEESMIEGLLEARQVIEKGAPYIKKQCLSSSALFNLMAFEYPDISIETNKRTLILTKMGFLKYSPQVKIDGKNHSIWLKEKMEKKEIRELLGKTGL